MSSPILHNIKTKTTNVRSRKDQGKNQRTKLPKNELILKNINRLTQAQLREAYNLVRNVLRIEEIGKMKETKTQTIVYITHPSRTVSVGKQLTRAFKGADIKISWSKTNKEVKTYVDFKDI